MRVLIGSILLSVVLALAAVHPASAKKRGGRIGGGYSGGSSQQIVKVLDLPDIPALRRDDGKYIDLGYLHNGSSSGKWIGYIGSSRSYLDLDENGIQMLLLAAGVDELPPVPKYEGRSSFWLWVVGGVIVFGLLSKLKNLFSGSSRREEGEPQAEKHYVQEEMNSSNTASMNAALDKMVQQRNQPQAPRRPVPVPGAQPQLAGAGRPTFGRRG